jgi:polyhydroxyalkanoate synthesis repressor PhaR
MPHSPSLRGADHRIAARPAERQTALQCEKGFAHAAWTGMLGKLSPCNEDAMADTVQTAPPSKTAEPPVVVKKYANRRLYDTRSSSYITLDNLAEMVREGRDFVVYDAKTGEDITRGVLTQIIVEEEGKGRSLLPTAFLRQLIGFYGDQMQSLVPKYLEQAMAAFAQQQEQMRAAMQKTMGSVGTLFPFGNIEEVSKQNMAMMERAFSLFTPFYRPTGEMPPARPAGEEPADEVAVLHAEVERLRQELAAAKEAKEPAATGPAPKEPAPKEPAAKV